MREQTRKRLPQEHRDDVLFHAIAPPDFEGGCGGGVVSRGRRAGSAAGALLGLLVALSVTGCASTRASEHQTMFPGHTAFEKVGIVDFRKDTLEDYQRLVRPGDLVVNYMRLGRAAKKEQWLFAILPHGHSMIVIDPYDPRGILECRFHGTRRVGPEELKLYSYSTVYRLRNGERLNMDRMREFADHGCENCRKYSFKSWIALNDNLKPDDLDDISRRYTCSTMVAAAYHFAGVTLDVAGEKNRVITPLSIAASAGRFNQFAVGAMDSVVSDDDKPPDRQPIELSNTSSLVPDPPPR